MNQEIISFLIEKGYLIEPELLNLFSNDFDKEGFLKYLESSNNLLIINEELLNCFLSRNENSNNQQIIINIKKEEAKNSEVAIINSFNEKSKKIEVNDFVNYYKSRYNALKEILGNRIELRDAISINRAKNKHNERFSLIGIVNSKRITKNENIILEMEDLSGRLNVLISKNKQEIYNSAKDVVLDEVIGLNCAENNGFVFVEKLFFPDIPVTKEFKKSKEEEYAVFISDLHVGNKSFLKKEFNKFLDWLNGRNGNNNQKEIVNKIKYLFVIGDLIDGVGIYPGQEKDLEITDLYQQYEEFSNLIKQVPEHINVIISPGNHDALRLDEPQPALGRDLLGDLLDRKNVFCVSNPACVNIGANLNFSGFDVLIYHGTSFPFYADTVDSIRLEGGLLRADLIMKLLLQKRHLAPTHTSISYLAGGKDNHIIQKVPDFFVSGHIHRCSVTNFNSVTLLNCGCWFPQSDYQEKRGLMPEPSKAIVVNLQTRDVKILNFGEDERE